MEVGQWEMGRCKRESFYFLKKKEKWWREKEEESLSKNLQNFDMRLTERDLDLLRTINAFGYVDINFITEKYRLKPNVAYRRLRRLRANKLIRHMYVYHQKPGIYLVTSAGVAMCQDELPALQKVSLATYDHSIAVCRASLALANRHQGEIITERQIRHQMCIKGVGQVGHVADGALVIDGKKIALEVELSVKGKDRLKKILGQYAMQIEYDAVWYVCGNANLFKRFQELEGQYSFIKCHLLKDVLVAV